jgi:hypothetical protein
MAKKSTRKARPARKPVKKAPKAKRSAKKSAKSAKKTAKKRSVTRKASPRARKVSRKAAARGGPPRKKVKTKPSRGRSPKKAAKAGGTGREATLSQTPETGRSVQGRTNPMPTRRSTGTPAGAGDSRRSPALDRERRRLREIEETVPGPPSSLSLDRVHPSAARSGRTALQHAKRERTETSPVLTGGDVDADWEDAYAVGDEAPGGDNPTPDQDRVDDIGRALGIEYADNEELKAADKIAERDKHRWELDPASAEDYPDHEED